MTWTRTLRRALAGQHLHGRAGYTVTAAQALVLLAVYLGLGVLLGTPAGALWSLAWFTASLWALARPPRWDPAPTPDRPAHVVVRGVVPSGDTCRVNLGANAQITPLPSKDCVVVAFMLDRDFLGHLCNGADVREALGRALADRALAGWPADADGGPPVIH